MKENISSLEVINLHSPESQIQTWKTQVLLFLGFAQIALEILKAFFF